jgi:iron complex outermembrane receptor protein
MKQFYFSKYGFLFCFLISSLGTMAQTVRVSGVVKDEENKTVPGATVILKGASKTTVTDANGQYILSGVTSGNQTITVSFIGYQEVSKQVNVTSDTEVNFKIEPSTTALAQVVVVGYGTQKRQDVTGSVSTISNKDLNPGPITNPLQQISGKAAGVNVTQTGSEPGSAPSIRIRGVGSLIGGNDPLVVVDGVKPGTSFRN